MDELRCGFTLASEVAQSQGAEHDHRVVEAVIGPRQLGRQKLHALRRLAQVAQ